MRRPSPTMLASASVLAAAAALLAIAPYALLVMAPALALAWLVAVGAFTGEDAIGAVRRLVRRLRTGRVAVALPTRRPRRARPACTGLVLAAALASRPPPATA